MKTKLNSIVTLLVAIFMMPLTAFAGTIEMPNGSDGGNAACRMIRAIPKADANMKVYVHYRPNFCSPAGEIMADTHMRYSVRVTAYDANTRKIVASGGFTSASPKLHYVNVRPGHKQEGFVEDRKYYLKMTHHTGSMSFTLAHKSPDFTFSR